MTIEERMKKHPKRCCKTSCMKNVNGYCANSECQLKPENYINPKKVAEEVEKRRLEEYHKFYDTERHGWIVKGKRKGGGYGGR